MLARRTTERRRRPRRVAFDLVFDSFRYPDGPLVGRVPPTGNVWVVGPGGDDAGTVVSDTLHGNVPATSSAWLIDAITLTQLGGDWWIRCVAVPGASAVNGKHLALAWGDSANNYYGFDFELGSGSPGGGIAAVVFGNVGSPEFSGTFDLNPVTEPKEFVGQFRAVDSSFEVRVDDVSLGRVVAPLGFSDLFDFVIDLFNEALSVSFVVQEVEAGLGVYS